MDIGDFDYLGRHILALPQRGPPPTFFSLPRMLRDRIYDYYFAQSFDQGEDTEKPASNGVDSARGPRARITSASDYNPRIQLLFTNRQIHTEARAVYYATHFRNVFFVPDSPSAAHALITSLARQHVESCHGEIRIHPNMHSTGLSVVSGYRTIDHDDNDSTVNGFGCWFVSVEFLELGLRECEGVEQLYVLLTDAAAAATAEEEKEEEEEEAKKDKRTMFTSATNVERYLCGPGWQLSVTAYQKRRPLSEEALALSGCIGYLNCLCGVGSPPKLKVWVKRKALKNIGSRFRELSDCN